MTSRRRTWLAGRLAVALGARRRCRAYGSTGRPCLNSVLRCLIPRTVVEVEGMRVFAPAAALIACPARFFRQRPVDARAALALVRDASDVSRRLLRRRPVSRSTARTQWRCVSVKQPIFSKDRPNGRPLRVRLARSSAPFEPLAPVPPVSTDSVFPWTSSFQYMEPPGNPVRFNWAFAQLDVHNLQCKDPRSKLQAGVQTHRWSPNADRRLPRRRPLAPHLLGLSLCNSKGMWA